MQYMLPKSSLLAKQSQDLEKRIHQHVQLWISECLQNAMITLHELILAFCNLESPC